SFGHLVRIDAPRSSQPFSLGSQPDYPVGLDLGHAASCRLGLQVANELVEVDVIANVETDVHHPRKSRTHMLQRLREAVRAAHWLVGVAILQQLDDDIVKLDKAHVQPLLPAPEIGDSQCSRTNVELVCQDLLIGQQRVLNAVALEIAVEEHFCAAEHFSV